MYSLIIDTSKDPGYLILARENEVVALKHLPPGSLLSKHIFPLIQTLVKEEYPDALENLKFVAVSRGPGSFTAARIGVSIAQTLCYALKIPMIAFTSPEFHLPIKEGPFIYIEKLKSGQHFILKGEKTESFLLHVSCELSDVIPHTTSPLISFEPFENAVSPLSEIDVPFAISYCQELYINKNFTDPSKISLVYTSRLS